VAVKADPAFVARINDWIDRYCAAEHVQLSEEQRAAIVLAGTRRLLVLTGGPGVGKTTTTRAIVRLLRAMRLRVLLASPTGRAAQRLAEVTGFPAQTIHRLLAFDPATRRFSHDREHPLEADAVIVDEASMLDLFLAHSLLKAIGPRTRLILVGDADQLPSVGPGNVLRDLLASGVVPIARLTKVFRQAATSLIITNAHRVNRGEFPRLVSPGTLVAVEDSANPGDGFALPEQEGGPMVRSDCTFLEATDPETAAALLTRIASTDLPRRLGLDPLRDVQVLCPMNRGELGAHRLNERLQALLNPPAPGKPEVQRYGITLRPGDKVIQRVNNYTLQVFNGEIGQVVAIDQEEQQVIVRFADGREVIYEYADLNELALAFAVTIHKAQGSEFPAVVLPIHTQHYPMLSRNLLYTGLTRARRAVVLIGSKKAIALAIRNVDVHRRYTALAERLQG
jgi:exodeoxyribonuclease V alpha subunit